MLEIENEHCGLTQNDLSPGHMRLLRVDPFELVTRHLPTHLVAAAQRSARELRKLDSRIKVKKIRA